MTMVVRGVLLTGVCMISQACPAQSPIPYLNLSVLWEVSVGGDDYMSTILASERAQYPSLGAIAYINGNTATYPLYRLYNGRDHMDSTIPGEGGYKTEGSLGSPWISPDATPGLASISRIYNPSTSDHATVMTGFGLSGYTETDWDDLYGYIRFLNQTSAIAYYAGGGVTEGSDFIAGGAVASWSWNGVQFINTHDYGRYMQSDVFLYDKTTGNPSYNPTEAGDVVSGSTYGQSGNWHGSPVLNNQITNGVHITRSIPLDFQTASLNAYSPDPNHPLIYFPMQIGKNLTLNFDNLGAVGQYNTVIVSPVSIPYVVSEIPTAYLNSSFGNFFTYDAGSNQLATAAVPSACTSGTSLVFSPPSGYGGVIIADSADAHALGIYGTLQRKGGNLDNAQPFSLWDFRNCGSTTKWNAVYTGPLQAGQNVFTTYVVTGTVSNVAADMQLLYEHSL